MTELSKGSIFRSMPAMTENSRSKMLDLVVDMKSSETPPPETRQAAAGEGRRREAARVRWREEGGVVGGLSEMRKAALVEAAAIKREAALSILSLSRRNDGREGDGGCVAESVGAGKELSHSPHTPPSMIFFLALSQRSFLV